MTAGAVGSVRVIDAARAWRAAVSERLRHLWPQEACDLADAIDALDGSSPPVISKKDHEEVAAVLDALSEYETA